MQPPNSFHQPQNAATRLGGIGPVNGNSGPMKDDQRPDDLIPLTARPVIPDPLTFRNRSMREALMGVVTAAEADITALATRQIGQISLKNNLGTERPPLILPGFDDDFQFLYLLPVANPVPGAVPISFDGGRASINLYVPFSQVNRLVPEGRREIYPLKPTPGKVTIGAVEAWGLYCRLSEVTSEPLTTLSEDEKLRRKATRERNKQKRNDSAAAGD